MQGLGWRASYGTNSWKLSLDYIGLCYVNIVLDSYSDIRQPEEDCLGEIIFYTLFTNLDGSKDEIETKE